MNDKLDLERPITEYDESRMRSVIKMTERDFDADGVPGSNKPLPRDLVVTYWMFDAMWQRLASGNAKTYDLIIQIVVESGVNVPLPTLPTIQEEIAIGQHSIGSQFEVSWRGDWEAVELLERKVPHVRFLSGREAGNERTIEPERQMRFISVAEVAKEESMEEALFGV